MERCFTCGGATQASHPSPRHRTFNCKSMPANTTHQQESSALHERMDTVSTKYLTLTLSTLCDLCQSTSTILSPARHDPAVSTLALLSLMIFGHTIEDLGGSDTNHEGNIIWECCETNMSTATPHSGPSKHTTCIPQLCTAE